MRQSHVLSTLLACVVLAASCAPKGASGPQKAAAEPAAPAATKPAASPTAERAPSPTPEWTSYSGEGVAVMLPSGDAVLPLTGEGWLFKAIVVREGGAVYALYVSSLGKNLGSSIEDLKRRRQADPNRLVVSEGQGECGGREFYRIQYVELPVKPGFVVEVVYYFYHEGELLAALFSCTSCKGPPDIEANYATWETIVSKMVRQ